MFPDASMQETFVRGGVTPSHQARDNKEVGAYLVSQVPHYLGDFVEK